MRTMALLDVETEMQAERAAETRDRMPTSMGDPIVAMALGSVLLSGYEFYAKGDEEDGIFVGLWAPTLLALASYTQQKRIAATFKRVLVVLA